MKNKKKVICILVAVLIIALLTVGLCYYKYVNKYKGTALEPMESMVSSLYYSKGDYDSYKDSFTSPKKALNKAQFESQQKSVKADKEFRYGSDGVRDVLKHMRIVEKGDTSSVYYLNNVNDDKEMKNSSFWTVVKKDGKWLIKND